MKILGAIIAGGQSRRFGSDKATALFQGKALLDHAAEALRHHVDDLSVIGRDWPGLVRVEDYPEPGLGPLGGLCGALHYARANGFDQVLTSGCDVISHDHGAIASLSPGPAIIASQPVVGLWPTTLGDELAQWIKTNNRRSLYGFAEHVDARRIEAVTGFHNINLPSDFPLT